MILLTTALQAEAQPLISHFKLKHMPEFKRFNVYVGENCVLAVTGVGVLKASSVTAAVLAHTSFSFVGSLNIGIAGTEMYSIGELYRINQIHYPTQELYLYPEAEPIPGIKTAGILCVDTPLHEKGYVSTAFPLVDMESAGFFAAAQLFLDVHQIEILKVVSDYLDGWVTKEKITSLIEAQLPAIQTFLEAKQWGFSTDRWSEHIDSWIKTLQFELPLTVTQQRLLTNSARFYLLRGHTFLPKFDVNVYDGKPKTRDHLVEKLNQLLIA